MDLGGSLTVRVPTHGGLATNLTLDAVFLLLLPLTLPAVVDLIVSHVPISFSFVK